MEKARWTALSFSAPADGFPVPTDGSPVPSDGSVKYCECFPIEETVVLKFANRDFPVLEITFTFVVFHNRNVKSSKQ